MAFAQEKAKELLLCGLNAIAVCKLLFLKVPEIDLKEAYDYTADVIARQRISAEAQEGINAFLEKCTPSWQKGNNWSLKICVNQCNRHFVDKCFSFFKFVVIRVNSWAKFFILWLQIIFRGIADMVCIEKRSSLR